MIFTLINVICSVRFISEAQAKQVYDIAQLRTNIVSYRQQLQNVVIPKTITLYSSTNTYFTQANVSYAFNITGIQQALYIPASVDKSGTAFGVGVKYMAEKLQSTQHVVVATYCKVALVTIQSQAKVNTGLTINRLIDGAEIVIFGQSFTIYAVSLCNSDIEIVGIHVFEQGALIQFNYPTVSNSNFHYGFELDNGSEYLHLSLMYLTAPCSAIDQVARLSETLVISALIDQLVQITTVIANTKAVLSQILSKVHKPVLFYGGLSSNNLTNADSNPWIDENGYGLLIKNAATTFNYQYDIPSFVIPLGASPLGSQISFRQSFINSTISTQVAMQLFLGVFTAGPKPTNSEFSISFQLKPGFYSTCSSSNATFIFRNITYRYQHMQNQGVCSDDTGNTLNSILAIMQTTSGNNKDLLDQNFTQVCTPTNQVNSVKNPRLRIFYLMYLEACNPGTQPNYDSDVAVDMLMSYMKLAESKCQTTCNRCATTQTTTCLECYPEQNRIISNSVCVCDDAGYYDDTVSITCPMCYKTCATCSGGASDNCKSCKQNGVLNGQPPNSCNCITQTYFNETTAQCELCHYSCKECVQFQKCSSCINQQRGFPTIQAQCLCQSGFYDDGANSLCKPCDGTCSTCSHEPNSCLTCNSSDHRELIGIECICEEGYFFNGVDVKCSKCQDLCKTCSSQANACISCIPSQNRVLDQTKQQCNCDLGYFEQNSENTCQHCDRKCLSCISSAEVCTSCKDGTNRSLFINEQKCNCIQRFFDDGLNSSCLQCSILCLTCQSLNYCLTCSSDDNRVLEPSKHECQCISRYFDVSGKLECQLCSLKCETCAEQNSNCISCALDSNRVILGTTPCECKAGYFEESNGECLRCNYRCGTCNEQAQLCTSCSDLNRLLDDCRCQAGYFDDGINEICICCSPKCKECLNSSDTCTVCDPEQNKEFNDGKCICVKHYFDTVSPFCEACSSRCDTCAEQSEQCVTCADIQNRILFGRSCNCLEGYYESVNLQCIGCHKTCYSCISARNDNCSLCDVSLKRSLLGSSCICIAGYYQHAEEALCSVKACLETCATCSTNDSCLTCHATQNRTLLGQECQCDQGYYSEQITCQRCYESCLTCSGASATDCLTCQAGLELSTLFKNVGSCLCPLGFFIKSPVTCEQCDHTCLSCLDRISTSCITCDDSFNRIFDNGKCICKLHFHEDTTLSCQPDHVVVVKPDPVVVVKPEGEVHLPSTKSACSIRLCTKCEVDTCLNCEQGYYSAQMGNAYQLIQECRPCDQRCKQCNGPTVSECESCLYTLSKGLCRMCQEINGLYTVGSTCHSKCGDGITYAPSEQCDDGNLDDFDGCASDCQVGLVKFHAKLFIEESSEVHTNQRLAFVTFNSTKPVFNTDDWILKVPGLQEDHFKLSIISLQDQVQIKIIFSKSTKQLSLRITPLTTWNIIEDSLTTWIPDTIISNESELMQAEAVVNASSILTHLIIIVIICCIFTGGLDMVWNIMDLFQLLSYFKFITVVYPLNVNDYFQYMSQFNFQFLLNMLPSIGVQNIYGSYLSREEVQTHGKFKDDGQINLFLYNILCVVAVWIASIIFYIGCSFGLKVLRSLEDLSRHSYYSGFKLWIYVTKFRILRVFRKIVLPDKITLITSGLIRISMQTLYDFNFATFLQLSRIYHGNDLFLNFSQYLCLFSLAIQTGLAYSITKFLYRNEGIQLNSDYVQRHIGAVVQGVKPHGIQRFFCMFALLKRSSFIAAIVLLQDYPMQQVWLISVMHVCSSTFLVVYRPLEDKEQQLQFVIREICLSINLLLILTFAIDEQLGLVSDETKFKMGWVIILSSLFILLFVMVNDMKKCFQVMQLIWKELSHKVHQNIKVKQARIESNDQWATEILDQHQNHQSPLQYQTIQQ